MVNKRLHKGFRLNPVLEHRRRLTDEAEQALAVRERERHEAETELEALRHERQMLFQTVTPSGTSTQMDVASLLAAETRDLHLRDSAFRQEQVVVDAEEREANARAVLLGRRVDQKVLEKLRDRHMHEQAARERAAEDQLIDEIATMRHGARQQAQNGGGA